MRQSTDRRENEISVAAAVEETVSDVAENTQDIWYEMRDSMYELNTFFMTYQLENVPTDELQDAYKNAVNLAAALERMLNHG